MHWFDSLGSFASTVARGRWPDGGDLVFEHRTHQGYARYVYRFPTPAFDVYVFRIESSRDGREFRPFMEGKYKRVG
jgi:hypothetical protein